MNMIIEKMYFTLFNLPVNVVSINRWRKHMYKTYNVFYNEKYLIHCFRWLASQGKIERATGILRKFQRINRTTVDENIYKQFKVSCQKHYIS